jgi:redox-sensitive bicupin YhaK (pirin superfamily)
VASPDGAEGSVTIHQDARVYATVLGQDQQVTHTLARNRHAWLHVARGTLTLNGHRLTAGDGAAITDEPTLTLAGAPDTEALLFDLP